MGSGDTLVGMAERSRSRAAWRWGTPLVAVACGAMFWTSHLTADPEERGVERYVDLASLVENQNAEVERLQQTQRELSTEVEQLTARVEDDAVQQSLRRERLARPSAGLTPVTGEGVSVTLSDAPVEVIESSDLDPNYFVVHQQHVQRVVNAMLAGGADAVTIQGQRIVSTTGIKCDGNAIQLDGRAFPQPFVIQGVGDQAGMVAAIAADPYLEDYRTLAGSELIQLGWDLDLIPVATAPAYDGALEAAYAVPMRRG